MADIFAAAQGQFPLSTLPKVVSDAFADIITCRTAALGGHVATCGNGHLVGAWYNACRNRSCPRCAGWRIKLWLERQARILLGCSHHHIIFTVPDSLNELWLLNRRALGKLLFVTARNALFALVADPRYVGALPGVLMALHSWGQKLSVHPHIHCLVTAGGLGPDGQWHHPRKKHFLPAEPLKRLFRGKLIAGLRKLAAQGKLTFPTGWAPADFDALCSQLRHKRWNVRVQERYSDPLRVLKYLGRYLHGGPISESRLVAFDGQSVSFRYKDYRREGPQGPPVDVMSLIRDEFIRRFLIHVPPKGFHLVRGYGLYHRGAATDFLREQALLRHEHLTPSEDLLAELTLLLTHTPLPRVYPAFCSDCGSPVRLLLHERDGTVHLAA